MTPPITRPTRDGYLLVADVSRFQGSSPPWQAMREAGVVAVIVKATEGLTYTDPMWSSHVRDAAEHGLSVGAYHVLRCNRDAAAQARRFHEVAFDRCALFPVCDFELTDGVDGKTCVERAVVFCEEVERLFQKRCVVYCGPGFISSLGVAPDVLAPLGVFALWLAAYVEKPKTMAPWASHVMWQWDDGHHARIANQALDLSWFRGTEIELARLGESLDK